MFFSSSSRKKSAAGATVVLPSVTATGADPDITSTTSLEQLTEAAATSETSAGVGAGGAAEAVGPGKLDIRSRINNLAFIFTLPHLVMLSNLQKLIGIRTGKKPSIQPNEYMDTLLLNAKTTMKGKFIFNNNKNITHWARKFKKVQPKKTREIKN